MGGWAEGGDWVAVVGSAVGAREVEKGLEA